jgi:hypothetical protein
LVKTGAVLGVRETRRVRGVATLTGEDVVSGRKRPVDGIGRASYSIDLHDDGRDGPKAKQVFGRETPPAGDWYEIPYGCLVPEGVDGLLVAGRCLSSDRWANGSLRIMPTCMATGQAAGVAAALCARDGIQPRHLEVERLRGVLRDGVGVILDQAAVHSNLNPEP